MPEVEATKRKKKKRTAAVKNNEIEKVEIGADAAADVVDLTGPPPKKSKKGASKAKASNGVEKGKKKINRYICGYKSKHPNSKNANC